MACLIYTDDQGTPSRLPLGKATLMLGSAADSEILLQDQSVSKNHASIIYDKGKFWLRDNGSTNGSMVNGKPAQYQQLQNGDTLQFGSYKFFFDEFFHTEEELTKTVSQDIKIIAETPVEKKGRSYRQTVQIQPHKGNQSMPMRMLLTEKVPTLPDPLSGISQTFGYLGLITFLPAIITGHLAQPKNPLDKSKQIVGLSLGYTFLILWILFGLYWLNKPTTSTNSTATIDPATQQTVAYEYPLLNNPLTFIKSPMVWLPPKGIYKNILFNDSNPAIESNAALLKEVTAVKSVFLHGLVWMELGTSAFKLQSSQQKLILTFETYRTNPTFWEYNSTMLPEKKTYYDPFFYAKETPQFFYEKDPSLVPPIARFADPKFPWCFGLRGVTFNLPPEFDPNENISNLRVVLVSRVGEKPAILNLETMEGNLTRDESKSYEYKVAPAVLYAAIVYRITDQKPLIVSTYEKYFSLDDHKVLTEWLTINFPEIISNQPSSSLAIAAPFTIKEKVKAPEAAKKPKINFFIQETK